MSAGRTARLAALSVVALLALLSIAPQVRFQESDQRTLLRIDGRAVDLMGQLEQHWTRWRRDCRAVWPVAADDPVHAQALDAIRGHSPPDSASARLNSLARNGAWLIAEAEFEQLSTAVVLLQHAPPQWVIEPSRIWSGSTHPWVAGPFIRSYLRQSGPDIPADLLDCFEPTSAALQ